MNTYPQTSTLINIPLKHRRLTSNEKPLQKRENNLKNISWFPVDRNVIVESYDSSMFRLNAERLMRIASFISLDLPRSD